MISQTLNRRSAGALSGRIATIGRALAVTGLIALAGCQEGGSDSLGYGPKHMRPIASATQAKMRELNMSTNAPILIRLYKEESTVEVWKKDRTGKFAFLQSYEICKWSGELGPKVKEGDRQAPEGFYTITPGLMNPRSSYHLAFNTGFPNSYDRSLGRTGSHLMVHGSCSSRGCYAMTDKSIQDIYAIAREAFKGGQRSFQLQAMPFRMTPENLAKHAGDPNMPFWQMLKEGSDHFEVTREEPKVDVCGRKYVFNAAPNEPGKRLEATAPCPILEVPQEISIAVASKRAQDEVETRRIIAELDAKRKRDEENKARDLMIASFLGAKGKAGGNTPLPAATEPPTGDPADATQIMIASVPIPQAAPGRAPVAMAAAQPAPAEGSAGWFASVFSFTDAGPAPTAAAQQTATAPAADAGAPTASTDAAPAAAQMGAQTAAATPPATDAAAAQPIATPAAPLAATPPVPAAPPLAAETADAPMTITPEPPAEKSVFAKAWGSIFSTN